MFLLYQDISIQIINIFMIEYFFINTLFWRHFQIKPDFLFNPPRLISSFQESEKPLIHTQEKTKYFHGDVSCIYSSISWLLTSLSQ